MTGAGPGLCQGAHGSIFLFVHRHPGDGESLRDSDVRIRRSEILRTGMKLFINDNAWKVTL